MAVSGRNAPIAQSIRSPWFVNVMSMEKAIRFCGCAKDHTDSLAFSVSAS